MSPTWHASPSREIPQTDLHLTGLYWHCCCYSVMSPSRDRCSLGLMHAILQLPPRQSRAPGVTAVCKLPSTLVLAAAQLRATVCNVLDVTIKCNAVK